MLASSASFFPEAEGIYFCAAEENLPLVHPTLIHNAETKTQLAFIHYMSLLFAASAAVIEAYYDT